MKDKLSYECGTTLTPLIGITIGDLFDQVVSRFPHKEALVSTFQGKRFTYEQLQTLCNRLAQGLVDLGLKEGDRIGIWSPNCWEWVALQIASAKIGAILVNINPGYRASELKYALIQSGCSMIVLAPPLKTTNYLNILREVCPELTTSAPGKLSSKEFPELHTVIVLGEQSSPGAFHFEQVVSTHCQAVAEIQAGLDFDSPINIQYTSGTTGAPKGATLSHHGMINSSVFGSEKMRLTDKDRYCIPLPFYHCAGMIMGTLASLINGATVVIPAPVFDPVRTLQAIESERCTLLSGVPTLFIGLLGTPEFGRFNVSTLRSGFVGGSPCPVDLNREIMAKLIPELTIVYGMTELSPLPIQTSWDDPLIKRESTVGRIFPHAEVKIVDTQTGKAVPRGQPGELCIRGYQIMLGYWRDPVATAKVIDAAGWLHSGDLAKMDADGYINIVGRSKDMVIRGGENIYPIEIEEMINAHPKISDVYVIGVPDEKFGEELMAWVRPKAGVALEADELREYYRDRITHFKIPRYWKITDQIPTTVSGKVQKFKLREMAIRDLGLEKIARIATS